MDDLRACIKPPLEDPSLTFGATGYKSFAGITSTLNDEI